MLGSINSHCFPRDGHQPSRRSLYADKKDSCHLRWDEFIPNIKELIDSSAGTVEGWKDPYSIHVWQWHVYLESIKN